MTHHFSCSGREKIKKMFLGPFDQIGPQIWAKKGHFGSKFSKKWKIFKNFFFQFEWFWVEKRPKKRWKIFFLTKLVWHLSFLAKKMRILDFIEFLSLFVSVRLCIFFGHRSSRCMLILYFILSSYLSFFFLS